MNNVALAVHILKMCAFLITPENGSALLVIASAWIAGFVVASSRIAIFVVAVEWLILIVEEGMPYHWGVVGKEINNGATVNVKCQNCNAIFLVAHVRRTVFLLTNFA